jgi:hypothetical protein
LTTQNCWTNNGVNGAASIDIMNYGNPIEHAYRNAVLYFYGSACKTYSCSQTVINEVKTTPYLGNSLQTQYAVSGTNYNSCATASKTITASADWILGIKVESLGSFYWVP